MKNKIILHLFLALLINSQLFGESGLLTYRSEFHRPFILNKSVNYTDTTEAESQISKYPARALLMSLVLPGAGQWYAEARLKALMFVATEVGIWTYWSKLVKKGEDKKIIFENYADLHWSLTDWVLSTPDLTLEFPDVRLDGTHSLTIFVDGKHLPADTLGTDEGKKYLNFDPKVVKDRDYYENIGKYDQFVAGWDDLYNEDGTNGYWVKNKKIEGDSTEVLVMTKRKVNYLGLRDDYNKTLRIAAYATSAIMFNHVISALNAAWEIKKRSRKPKKVDSSLGLLYSPYNRYGIGGVKLSLSW